MNFNEIEEDEIDIRRLFEHLKNNIKSILFITFMTTVIAALYAYYKPAIYSSDVSIAFSDEKTSKLTSIIPDELSALSGSNEKELETVKLTLETRKFINSVIKDLNLSQRYYLVNELHKKNEVYNFEDLKINLTLLNQNLLADEQLYGEFFEIIPLSSKKFLLKIEKLDYEKEFKFNKQITAEWFTLKVEKTGLIQESSYFITKSDETRLADSILENMTVSILSDNVLKIVYSDTVAKRAKELTQEIALHFIDYTLKKTTNELSQTLSFLDREIEEIQIHLQGEGNRLKDYQKNNEVFFSMESNIALYESVNDKDEMIETLKLQKSELKNFKTALEHNKFNTIALLNSGVDISSIQSLIELFRSNEVELNEMKLQLLHLEKPITQNKALIELIQELNKEKKLLDELTFNFTSGHPQVLKAQNDYAEMKNSIVSYIQTTIQRLKESQRSLRKKINHNILMAEKTIDSKLKMLTKNVKKKERLLKSLPEKEMKVQELKRKFTLSENIYTFLLQKKMELQISKASTIANTQIIENSREALKPTKPNKKLIVVVGLILGFILGIFYIVLKKLLDTKIRDTATVTELTDAPLYGVLPMKSNKRFFEEALRSIRTNLQFVIPHEKNCKIMLLSSTIPGEGKTTVTAGLTHIMAQTGKKVLVMDLDLRKPRLYEELNRSNKNGMTQYLTMNLNLSDCIQHIDDNLDFFPAGAVPPNPSELLMSEKFEEVISQLMEQYEYIIFDTAPIGSVIDANLLLKYSDIVLLVLKANVAEKSFLEHFNRLRVEKNIKSAGVILNQLKQNHSRDYGYGYGYGYGGVE
jgi:capsular exopolysaccharide synthesis family protein